MENIGDSIQLVPPEIEAQLGWWAYLFDEGDANTECSGFGEAPHIRGQGNRPSTAKQRFCGHKRIGKDTPSLLRADCRNGSSEAILWAGGPVAQALPARLPPNGISRGPRRWGGWGELGLMRSRTSGGAVYFPKEKIPDRAENSPLRLGCNLSRGGYYAQIIEYCTAFPTLVA